METQSKDENTVESNERGYRKQLCNLSEKNLTEAKQ
jgi:hypothetical protein